MKNAQGCRVNIPSGRCSIFDLNNLLVVILI